MNKYVFGEQTLAYIDLDLYIQRTSTDKTIFEVSSSPALQTLIQHVLHQVSQHFLCLPVHLQVFGFMTTLNYFIAFSNHSSHALNYIYFTQAYSSNYIFKCTLRLKFSPIMYQSFS